MSKRWTQKEISKIKMALERRREKSTWEIARQLSLELNRSTNAINHKLKEIIVEHDYASKEIDLLGESYPVEVVSGYLVITLPDGRKVPAHHFVFRTFNKCEIPNGYVVHHLDARVYNNNPNNLVLMSASDHMKLHGGHSLPETTFLFHYLQEKNLWEDYLNWRDQCVKEFKFPEEY